MYNFHHSNTAVQHWMECYNIIGELDDDGPRDIHILEYEGTREMDGSGVLSDKFMNPLKMK